jgi:ABC-2 type transport system ATP-binding protein
MTDMIAVRGVTKSFGKTPVLRGIDLTVARGTVVALLGPNGAGKTTLINILSTLVAPDGGTATVAGHDVVREREAVKRQISLTGQSAAVDEILTGEENLPQASQDLQRRDAAAARSGDQPAAHSPGGLPR